MQCVIFSSLTVIRSLKTHRLQSVISRGYASKLARHATMCPYKVRVCDYRLVIYTS